MHHSRFTLPRQAAGGLLMLLSALLLSGCFGDGRQTTIRPATHIGDVIQDVYALVTWIDIGIFVVVAALLLFAIIRYRARPGQEDQLPRQTHGNAAMEVVWTLIPAVILIFIAVPTWSGIFQQARPPAEGAIQVQAIGHQWWWEFRYPELGVTTANELYVPVDRPIVVETWSEDVIHSFWVPRLAGKIDSLPGKRNTVWFDPRETGLFYGQCAEFCGTSHANMRFRVSVVSEDEFEQFLADAQQPPAPQTPAAEEGQQLFVQKGCIACHTIEGVPGAVGTLGPRLNNLPARSSLAAGILETNQENMVRWLRETQQIKPGAEMGTQQPDGTYVPEFAGSRLSEDEAGKLAAFLLSPPAEAEQGAEQAAGAAGRAAAEPAAEEDGAETEEAPAETTASAQQLITNNGCGACHVIPGVPGTVGTIGPSLEGLMSRDTIAAGNLELTEENLRKWLDNPKAIKPDTVMPNLPLSEAQLDTLVDFLTTLE